MSVMRIAVIGLGLIGGSALLALSRAQHEVVGYDADPSTRRAATEAAAIRVSGLSLGPRWRIAHSVADAVADTDLTLIAVPFPAVKPVCDLLADEHYGGLVSDMTSVKQPVLRLARDLLSGTPARFVGGHPMAGRETSGFVAADPVLFDNCSWVLCLEPDTPLADWLTLAEVITSLGARIVPTTAEDHDRAVALISHVPHLLATALAACAGQDPLALALAAGSFRDATRVASTRSELIAAMCGGNAAPVSQALDEVTARLAEARTALNSHDPISNLIPLLDPGRDARLTWQTVALDQDPPPTTVPTDRQALLEVGRAGGWIIQISPDHTNATVIMPD